MVVSCSYEPSVGGQVAKLVCACLPPDDATKVVNTIRKLFGLSTFKINRKKHAK